MDLKAAREAKGLTQDELARRVGVTRRTVIRCEQQNRLPQNALSAAAYRKALGLR